jgi:hypothetical protein
MHAATVIALSGVAFRVFVGEHGALGFPDFIADKVFRGDEFHVVFLAVFLPANDVKHFCISHDQILHTTLLY